MIESYANEFSTVFGSFLLGGGLMLLIVKFFIERWLNNFAKKQDALKQKNRERFKADYDLRQATGTILYHAYIGIEKLEKDTGKSYWNGEMKKAFEIYEAAEKKCKALDVDDLADANLN